MEVLGLKVFSLLTVKTVVDCGVCTLLCSWDPRRLYLRGSHKQDFTASGMLGTQFAEAAGRMQLKRHSPGPPPSVIPMGSICRGPQECAF